MAIFVRLKTRPILVGNTDNCLLANAIRMNISNIIEPWIDKVQRGFIRERYMLANVVDIDENAMTISLKSERGSIILFDFRAAFPSISLDFMWRTLRHIGMPEDLINALQSFYVDNRHIIKVNGNFALL